MTKNRFDGDLGLIPLTFKKESLSYGVDITAKSRRIQAREGWYDDSPKSFNRALILHFDYSFCDIVYDVTDIFLNLVETPYF